MKNFQNTLDIFHKNSRSESPEAAEIFTGLVMGFEKAEENLQKAYSIRKKSMVPAIH